MKKDNNKVWSAALRRGRKALVLFLDESIRRQRRKKKIPEARKWKLRIEKNGLHLFAEVISVVSLIRDVV